MKRKSILRSGKISNAMKAAALEVGKAAGIRPLAKGEQRPANFYVVNHFTGAAIVKDRNAVIPKTTD
jgi:hypothetical protein